MNNSIEVLELNETDMFCSVLKINNVKEININLILDLVFNIKNLNNNINENYIIVINNIQYIITYDNNEEFNLSLNKNLIVI